MRTGNTVEATTDGVWEFTLLISPDAFDLSKPIKVVANGRVVFDGRVEPSLATLHEVGRARQRPDHAVCRRASHQAARMTIEAGRRIGPYEIVAPIGAGGMGEVYRARDTKLGREVAIKVLPDALSADRDRLTRFEREARVLAALNHPNIATIYGVEETAGASALVMELVEGETLAEKLSNAAEFWRASVTRR